MKDLSSIASEQRDRLVERLASYGSALVAFSGGVDSATLLKTAVVALGADKVMGVCVTGDIFPSWEVDTARSVAREHDLPLRVIEASPMELSEFVENSSERCYYCKRFLFSRLIQIAKDEGWAVVLEGANADDVGDHRPGMRAVEELGARAPLKDLGIAKAQIREIAHAYGLGNWDEPSAACLASRVPYGQIITEEKLARIDGAERFLRQTFHLRQVRARHDGLTARIEVPPEDISRLAEAPAREAIVAHLRELGFQYVTLDLLGYRMGSLNEVLS